MRFSEQVVLGSCLIHFQPEFYLHNQCGCLIGMAGAAVGEECFSSVGGQKRMTELWPWLFEHHHCVCPRCQASHQSLSSAISCMAYHVGRGESTFERALEFIREVEPKVQVLECEEVTL